MFKNDSREKALLDVNEVILEVMALLRSELQNRQIAVQDELSPKLPPVLADAVQLQQVIVNLVTNAFEAMDAVNDGARTLRVKSAISKSDGVLITVEDSGLVLIRKTWTASFIRSSRRSRRAWGWVCRFADPLLRPTMGISRHVLPFLEDQSSRFRCRLEQLLAPADCVPDVAFRSILLKNSKMELKQKFATDRSRPVFGNRMPCSRATKRAGWKSAWTYGPSHYFSMSAPAPLKKIDSSQERTFSTEPVNRAGFPKIADRQFGVSRQR
jgi:hypothetical protein